MKKFGKRLIVVAVIGGLLYLGYLLFVMPSGYTERDQLAEDFFLNMNAADACDTYFNPETVSHCASFVTLFDGETLTVEDTVPTSRTVIVTVDVGGNTASFEVSFVEEEVGGIKGFFNPVYYKIDIIQ